MGYVRLKPSSTGSSWTDIVTIRGRVPRKGALLELRGNGNYCCFREFGRRANDRVDQEDLTHVCELKVPLGNCLTEQMRTDDGNLASLKKPPGGCPRAGYVS